VMQGVFSNYRTDLLMPLMETVRSMTGHTIEERDANITPYRVIADHTRAGAFLIGDGVVPGNTGRNYVCRMIIRRAARFGSKIGLHEPFLARVAETLINNYGEAYPELLRNRKAILDGLTREEERFKKTLNTGLSFLDDIMADMRSAGKNTLEGNLAFDLYATHGLPLEITRDILRENGLEVDEPGFRKAMEDHRIASGAGKSFGALGGEDADTFRLMFEELMEDGLIDGKGVQYNPYNLAPFETKVLALVKEGEALSAAAPGDVVEVLLPRTNFYVESGGQVSDTGTIRGDDWEIQIVEMRKPAAGVIVHIGKVVSGTPRVGDSAVAAVDVQRRRDTMRNHTATHLMHAVLHRVVGEHARQAGSLVAP
ncbi:alanine--tRNA ligase, partial [bacterium]|nr:alanine--tRNA ligase [bacterium]